MKAFKFFMLDKKSATSFTSGSENCLWPWYRSEQGWSLAPGSVSLKEISRQCSYYAKTLQIITTLTIQTFLPIVCVWVKGWTPGMSSIIDCSYACTSMCVRMPMCARAYLLAGWLACMRACVCVITEIQRASESRSFSRVIILRISPEIYIVLCIFDISA